MAKFYQSVYEVVSKIPKGRVASYGWVSRQVGFARKAQQVGWALHVNPDRENIPCHRVVNKDGRLSTAFAFGGENAQRKLLESEGVEFIGDCVDMARFAL